MTRNRILTVLALAVMACVLGRGASAATLATAFDGLTFDRATSIQQVRGNPSRWFVAERGGLIKTFSTNDLAAGASVALNISSYLQYTDTRPGNTDSQQWGITSIAPSLSFRTNGYMYVAYNRRPMPGAPVSSYLSRFRANFASDPEGAILDPQSEQILLTLDQTTQWHHIGQILFGPGNYLYIGTGDGANLLPDTRACRAQDPRSLFGKILRIDVNTVSPGRPYGIPASNPYPTGVNGAPEVYASGFRNPWRFSFDRVNIRDMWLGDAGEAAWEEVDRVVKLNFAAGQGNYGWPLYEARRRTQMNCQHPVLTPPVYAFTHADGGAAVIGGYVYRGSAIPSLQGSYIFAGFGVPKVYRLAPPTYTSRSDVATFPAPTGPSGFYEELTSGELYAISSVGNWPVYQLVP